MRKREINRILKIISNQIRPYLNLLIQYQDFLSDIDVLQKQNMLIESMGYYQQ
jgi:hypothetical protein